MKEHKLCNLNAFLQERIIGQEKAVELIVSSVLRSELGLRKKNRPKGGMLLLGPTGVGKTECVLSVSEYLFGGENRVKRFDMAEFQNQESLKTLLGSSKSEQGVLGDAIDDLNEQGGGVLLFDEIEKSYSSMSGIFLAALDAGRISMSNGDTKNLENCYLFFTSNLGSSNAVRMINSDEVSIKKCIENAARNYFSPELFARFEEIVIFKRLDYDDQLKICKNMLKLELEYLTFALDIPVKVEDNVFSFLIEKGYTRELGARMMRKTIERELGNALVSWKLKDGHEGAKMVTINANQSTLEAA